MYPINFCTQLFWFIRSSSPLPFQVRVCGITHLWAISHSWQATRLIYVYYLVVEGDSGVVADLCESTLVQNHFLIHFELGSLWEIGIFAAIQKSINFLLESSCVDFQMIQQTDSTILDVTCLYIVLEASLLELTHVG